MKPFFILSGLLLMAALACSFAAPAQPDSPPVVVTQVVSPSQPECPPVSGDIPAQTLLEAQGKSSAQLNTEIEPYIKQAGWESWGVEDDDLIIYAAPSLNLDESTLRYRLHFDTSKSRYLGTVITQLYFVPEKVGTPFDQTLLFNSMETNFPNLSIFSDMEFMNQYTFRGVYTFNARLDVADFIDFLNSYAVSVDELLIANPYFSKQ